MKLGMRTAVTVMMTAALGLAGLTDQLPIKPTIGPATVLEPAS